MQVVLRLYSANILCFNVEDVEVWKIYCICRTDVYMISILLANTQLPIYNAIYRDYNPIYNDRGGAPCRFNRSQRLLNPHTASQHHSNSHRRPWMWILRMIHLEHVFLVLFCLVYIFIYIHINISTKQWHGCTLYFVDCCLISCRGQLWTVYISR